jgi:hypothetical protein
MVLEQVSRRRELLADLPNVFQHGQPVSGVDIVDLAIVSLPYARRFRLQAIFSFAWNSTPFIGS